MYISCLTLLKHTAHSDMVLFRVLCAGGGSVVLCSVQLFASRLSSRCKHDMGTLWLLNVETLERVHTPVFGRFVRCCAHERSLVRQEKKDWCTSHADPMTVVGLLCEHILLC